MHFALINIPYVKHVNGQLQTGPNSGSRWPFALPGKMTAYAPYPFFMGLATSYLKAHGVEAEMLDFMALRMFEPFQWKQHLQAHWASFMVFEISAPTAPYVLELAKWANEELATQVVLVGPHCASHAQELLRLPYVRSVVQGEYDAPLLTLAQDSPRGLFTYDHVENIDTLPNGDNWTPYRDLSLLPEYYDPSVRTEKCQLTVSTSRGCFKACNYCQWPTVMSNKTYRARKPEMVLDEIRTVIKQASATTQRLGGTWAPTSAHNPNDLATVRSVFFDDDTWGLGAARVRELCAGMKGIGLPWSLMTRFDIHKPEAFDLMFESGAVAIRGGIETFAQHVLDRTNGGRDSKKQYDAARYILTRFKNIEVHFTSMRDMPGQSEADWQKDQEIFAELRHIGELNGNRVHHQCSRAIPFPGTDLEQDMRAAGHGDLLDRADFNGAGEESELNRAVRSFVPLSVKGHV